jgi:DNA invertase Pin-like site-specific DNA recombinase
MRQNNQIGSGPTNVAIYVRTGTSDKEERQASEDRQIGSCVRWCHEAWGANGFRVSLFLDSGSSANCHWAPSEKRQHRAALGELVAAVREGTVGVIVVTNPERLFRSCTLHQEFFDEVLVPHGVRLVSADDGNDLTPFDWGEALRPGEPPWKILLRTAGSPIPPSH